MSSRLPLSLTWFLLSCLFLIAVPRTLQAQDASPDTSQAEDSASDEGDSVTLEVGTFLALPSVELLAPAWGEDDATAFDRVMLPLDDLEPHRGDSWDWPGAGELTWETFEGSSLGEVGEVPALRVLAFQVHTDAFVKAKVIVRSSHPLHVRLNGEELGEKSSSESADEDPGVVEKEVPMPRGDHTVIVVATGDPAGEAPWTVEAMVEVAADRAEAVSVSTRENRRLRLADVLDPDSPGSMDLSPDGRILALGVSNPAAPRKGRRTWVEFLDTRDGRVIRSLEGMGDLSSFEWAPDDGADRYSFVTREDGKATLWVGRIGGGTPAMVLKDVEDFGRYSWTPDGQSLVFSKSEDGAEDPDDFKRYRGLSDRWGGSRKVSTLYQASVASGVVRRLTAGDLDTGLEDIAPASDRLLFTRGLRDDATWPFSQSELVELDLATLEVTVLATELWGLSAAYGPKGDTIAITGPPQAFDGAGEAVADDVEPNLYESQLYLMDRATGEVRAVSRDFDPAIDGMAWVGGRNEIVVQTTDRSFGRLFHYDVGKDRWRELETPVEVVQSMVLSRDGKALAYRGSSSNLPSEIHVGSPGNWRPERIKPFDPERFARIEMGEVKDYSASVGDDTLIGRVYYPPDFDAAKKWPTIVYYYGGTVPVTRTFGGRYPKEWWAAQGYLVYVMQPSGATGFGQEFAARHVNNWGITVADEIIAATKSYLAAHEFADPERVGCIGASYGGFMTMLLTTRTDIFSAAVSHAGISSISSYWGEGNWGFSYSAAATAKSYPWNRPDIYVDQSPLFAADEIHTPLLLLHGSIDDNVPPGESEQLYTALRVLGREVEYIRVEGERHWILQYEKRERWSKSIIAWFDKHLKNQSGWWDELWPSDSED